MNDKIKELRKKAMSLPLQSGVYIMKNKQHEIIYIGKAKALKNRVSQYFGSQNNHTEKVKKMVDNVYDFDYIITDSEFEALVLECSLIKQHTPKYNILLKDDKGYCYIRVSNDKWRKISLSLQKNNDGATYIGPYVSSYYVKNAIEQATKIFKLPTCNKVFPRDFNKSRPCLNYHLNQCSAPCNGKVNFEDYNEAVNSALEFLKGGSTNSLKQMTEDMQNAAENLEFERAAKLRDRINSVKQLSKKQKVMDSKILEQDIIAYATDGEKGCFEIFRFNGGRLFDRENFVIDNISDTEPYTDFIVQFYSMRNDIPKYITLDKVIQDKEILGKWLTQKRGGKKVYFLTPKRGEQLQLVKMCKNNAYERLAQTKGSTGKEYSVLEELKSLLNLPNIPEYIECYDISNSAGTENVAGMVVYQNGKPLKSAYKKFKIKSFDGQDDFGSMAEVLERRFNEYLNSADKTTGFGRLPDLILLDGGKGQVSAVLPVLKKLNIDVAVFGLVKDDHHRTRAITTSGSEIEINYKRNVFTFLSKMQDEVHRFAIGYHRQRRNNATFKTSLTQIDGIGETRAKALLKHFRTIANIKVAEIEELENTPTMNSPSAHAVYNFFHQDNDN